MTDVPNIPNLFSMSDRTAVVVGSGSGLGQVSALGLADSGAHVVCADLNTEAAETTAQIIAERGGSAEAFTVDITDSGLSLIHI